VRKGDGQAVRVYGTADANAYWDEGFWRFTLDPSLDKSRDRQRCRYHGLEFAHRLAEEVIEWGAAHVGNGSWPRENSNVQCACRNSVSIS
jgi:hypothetical protein